MQPLHAAIATPSQKLAAAGRRERQQKIAAQARPDTPIACPSASVRSRQASGLRPAPRTVPQPTEPPKTTRAPVGTWFWIIEEISPRPSLKLSIEEIQTAVERHCKVGHLELISARRTSDIVRSRQIAMYLAKNLTPHSLPVIGRKFGGRDHTTVLHAVRKIEALRTLRPDSGRRPRRHPARHRGAGCVMPARRRTLPGPNAAVTHETISDPSANGIFARAGDGR